MGHSILFKQCCSDHMTRGRSQAIDRIVINYTATLASAHNNAIYFSRNEWQGSSAHYFMDDITDEVYQSVAEGDTAWHAGNWLMNCRSVGIKVVSADEDYSGVEVGKLAWLVHMLMDRYGIPEGGVIRNYDVTGKIRPAPHIGAGRWAALRSRIYRSAGSSGATSAGSLGGGSAPSGDAASLARRVINGEFGSGEERKRALGSRYSEVQAEVNRILSGGGSGGSSSSGGGVDIDALARAVINGDYGNGEERKRRLCSSYAAVQRRVNQMFS